uniref:Uncharacterized protein n=1 Tax=Fagus sylvatica TaxID=28930 RepID=A0A2N9GAH2_FAGSY
MAPRAESTGVFLVRLRAVFRSGFRLDPDKFLAIREFHVVHDVSFFPMCPGSQINLLRVRKTLCASVATSVGKFRKFQHSLISSACFHARGRRSSRCRISTILVSSESLRYLLFNGTRPCTEASLGSQDMILRTEAVGMFLMPRGVVSSIQFLVWSTVRSNLGQTWSWSNLVGIWSKLSKLLEMYPGLHFKGFWARRTLVGLETARSNLGQTSVNPSQTWSTLVKLGQTLGNVSLGPSSWEYLMRSRASSDQTGLVRAASFCVPTPEKIPGVSSKLLGCRSFSVCCQYFLFLSGFSMGHVLADLPGFIKWVYGHILTFGKLLGRPSLTVWKSEYKVCKQIGVPESKHVEGCLIGSLGKSGVPSGSLETKFVIRVRIGLGDHPGLETETNRGRIGLGDHPGLETKFVIRVRIGLGDHPGLETETNRGRIGLGDHPGLETKFVIRVRIGLGDHPGLETETNRGRIGLGDHPGLETKFVIRVRIGLGDHPGLETETNRGRIGLGDHPGLETKFVIRVRIGLGDHPGLETETNRGRIGLGDHPGLETKFVIRVRIGLGDHPGLETETNRGRIGLGDHPGLETKFVIRVRIGLGDHPGLETETNRGRIGLGDHPGLETKFVIRVRIGLGDHPGLETEANRGRIGLGDNPVYLAFLALGLPVALSYRCLTEVVVAEIVAGPHLSLLGFVADGGIPCGPFLRDFGSVCFRCHASFIEVVVALFVGSECTCIPYFRLSYLTVLTTCFWSLAHLVGLSNALDHSVRRHFLNLRSAWLNLRLFQLIPDGGSTSSLTSGLSSNFSGRGKIAPVWYNEINEFLIPGLRYYHRFGRFCKRCPFAWMM